MRALTNSKVELQPEDIANVDTWFWAMSNRIRLQAGEFSTEGRAYQAEILQSTARVRVYKKATQGGWTEVEVLRTLHGLIYGLYPKGVLYLFPTETDVEDFSRTRFNPLIKDNYRAIGKYLRGTDSTEIKRVGRAILYLRGAKSTQKVEGYKREAHQLRSIPVDKVVYDEEDLMDPAMVFLALQRMSDSQIKEEVHIANPTIPDFGVDKKYSESNQKIWVITCNKCNRDCCLELDFPECVKYNKDGKAYRACIKCGAELNPSEGQWVARVPSSEIDGYWWSQLNSLQMDPGYILKVFENPPNGNIQEVYNSILGMAYIAAENRLTPNDVFACCREPLLASRDDGPCGMGVDVGKNLHVVVGKRIDGQRKRIVYVGEVGDFSDIQDLCKRFNVRSVAIDAYPETRKARDLQRSLSGVQVTLVVYMDRIRTGEKIDEVSGMLTLARTEICDTTYHNITRGMYLLPRRNPKIEEYAQQLSNTAKVLEEDERRGTKVYRYKKLAADHYFHATNYFELASRDLAIALETPAQIFAARLATAQTSRPYDVFGGMR